ncbi:MAG: RidA family protein [Phycisphaerae bacterium]|nr:RidA family protein [Phycisphaerae bacterium]
MNKKIHQTPSAPKAVGPYSQAVEANGFLFISGQIPIDPATGKMAADDIEEQTHRALKNIQAILDAAGLSLREVVKTTCLLSDMKHFPQMNEVYAQYFPEEPPARATFAVAGLPLGAMVEIEAIAVRE